MSISRSLLQLLLVTSLAWLLIACEGSNTVANPNLSSGDLGYTGPLTIEREIPDEPARQKEEISHAVNLLNKLKAEILG